MCLTLDRRVYHPSHGPRTWPWWRQLSVTIGRCTHDPPEYFWMTPVSYNVWFYTRWGAICLNWCLRRSVRRSAE